MNPVVCLECGHEFPPAVPQQYGVHPVRCPDSGCSYLQDVRVRPIRTSPRSNGRIVAWVAESVPRE